MSVHGGEIGKQAVEDAVTEELLKCLPHIDENMLKKLDEENRG